MSPLRWTAVALAALAVVALPAVPAPSQSAIGVELVDTAVVTAPALGEMSGIEASSRPGVYWTLNDSGNRPMLFAIDSAGRLLQSLRVAGAANRDWEALAAGPCFVRPGRCLYIGDIGDNGRRRRAVVVYRVREPEPGGADSVAPLLDSLVLTYPDGAHDAEGLAVTADGRVLVTTKDLRGPARLFTAPARAGAAPLALLCALALRVEPFTGRLVTGLAIDPAGTLLVARTYVSLHLFRLDRGCTPLLGPSGIVIPVVEHQGEAVAFDGADRLVLASERGERHAIITRLRLTGLP